MDYQEQVILDFAKRTRKNLEFIETSKQDGMDVFEVTQLANSMLGLLVFPRERYIRNIPETPISELREHGWPEIETTFGELPEQNLKELVRMLRNGIAHCNVKFLSEAGNSEITGLEIWNNNKKGKMTWRAKLSISDLRLIAFKFIELIEAGSTH